MPKKFSNDSLSEAAFMRGESGIKTNSFGQGSSYAMDLHGSKPRSGRIQTPAQHAAVKKAAAASVARRKSRVF